MTAGWRKLAFFNYAVDPEILKPYLAFGTELDLWQGKCYVSLVGFLFVNVKLKGIFVPFHTNFEEINLRFYVRYKENDVWKRGVTFISEIVPRPLITFVANTIYNEKYLTLPTRHHWKIDDKFVDVGYEFKFRNEWNELGISASPTLTDIAEGSEEEFITEHYWGYTKLGASTTSQYQVEHPRWQMYPVKNYQVNVPFAEFYGSEFGSLKDRVPDSVMLAEGSPITIRGADKIKGKIR